MAYLALDVRRAHAFATTLRQSSTRVDPVQHLLSVAQQLADLHVPVTLLLDEIELDYRAIAVAVERAVQQTTRLLLSPWTKPARPRADVGNQARWNASPHVAWNRVQQESSHNTFHVPGGVAALYDVGVRSFELDIHRGAPTTLDPGAGWRSPIPTLVTTVADHLDHNGGRPGDWRVYHTSGDAMSEYDYLSDGLAAVASLDATDPITIFVDVKDDFAGTHTGEQLSQLVRNALGPRLFDPAAMFERSPGAASLRQVVAAVGWPTVDELQGKVLVVLTGSAAQHHEDETAAYFVAQTPDFFSVGEHTVHLPHESDVFYNVSSSRISTAEIAALQATGAIVRTYSNPLCGSTSPANYRATDVTAADEECDE